MALSLKEAAVLVDQSASIARLCAKLLPRNKSVCKSLQNGRVCAPSSAILATRVNDENKTSKISEIRGAWDVVSLDHTGSCADICHARAQIAASVLNLPHDSRTVLMINGSERLCSECLQLTKQVGLTVMDTRDLGGGAPHTVSTTAQAVVLDSSHSSVLLKRHSRGGYAGRWTSFIENIPNSTLSREECRESDAYLVRKILADHCLGYGSSEIVENVSARLGLLEFYEIGTDDPPNLEVEFVATLASSARKDYLTGREARDGSSLAWFPRDSLPWDEMPADDIVWYESIITSSFRHGHSSREWSFGARGQFIFKGEDMILSNFESE